jgi:hypothetical protein
LGYPGCIKLIHTTNSPRQRCHVLDIDYPLSAWKSLRIVRITLSLHVKDKLQGHQFVWKWWLVAHFRAKCICYVHNETNIYNWQIQPMVVVCQSDNTFYLRNKHGLLHWRGLVAFTLNYDLGTTISGNCSVTTNQGIYIYINV